MKRWTIIFGIFILYYAVAGYALYAVDAGIVMTALALYGAPAVLLAHYSYAPTSIILSVACLGLGIGILTEGIAHIFGLWYTLGATETRLFGLIPVEVLIVSALQAVFLALLYELFFDDGVYSRHNGRTRFVAFLVFALSALVLVALYRFLFQGVFIEYSYVWILGIIGAALLAALGVYRAFSIHFFNRLTYFSLVGAIPLGIGMVLTITNSHKFFANPDQYLFTWQLFGQIVALEEVLLIFALPFLVATMYELYLDDRE